MSAGGFGSAAGPLRGEEASDRGFLRWPEIVPVAGHPDGGDTVRFYESSGAVHVAGTLDDPEFVHGPFAWLCVGRSHAHLTRAEVQLLGEQIARWQQLHPADDGDDGDDGYADEVDSDSEPGARLADALAEQLSALPAPELDHYGFVAALSTAISVLARGPSPNGSAERDAAARPEEYARAAVDKYDRWTLDGEPGAVSPGLRLRESAVRAALAMEQRARDGGPAAVLASSELSRALVAGLPLRNALRYALRARLLGGLALRATGQRASREQLDALLDGEIEARAAVVRAGSAASERDRLTAAREQSPDLPQTHESE